VVLILAFAVLALYTGAESQTDTSLVVDGFDPDRAQLITSLLFGAGFAAAVTLICSRVRTGVLFGSLEAGALFAGTFFLETQVALRSGGVDGDFDLGGWLLTVLTLAMSGVVSAWAGAGLASLVRPSLAESASAVAVAVRQRRVARARLRYPAALAAVLALLALTGPIFFEFVNFTPDVLMRQEAAMPPFPAFSTDPSDAPFASSPDSAQQDPTQSAAPRASSPSRALRPWLNWRPSGQGLVTVASLAAPWKGGSTGSVEVSVYTPPGYASNPTRTYPVLYEAPFPYSGWNVGAGMKTVLDNLINAGSIPATIAVFVAVSGGPYPDTECANSFDGREWVDSFIAQTVVGWVDEHYRTIATPAARSITGMSQGGYCAAILALHHPDVFGTAISFSGYYQAGAVGLDSQAPFGGNKTLIAKDSPAVVAGTVDPTVRRRLYFVLVAKPDQPGYGSEAVQFEKELATYDYPYRSISTTMPHGWTQVRNLLPSALESWASREVSEGVFST